MSRYSGDIDRMKNQISSIRGKINQLQREINVIQNEITALGTSSANANAQLVNNVNKINSTLSNNKNVVEYSHSQLSKTFSTQLQIREMFFIFKDIEGANKTIRALTNDLYFNYKNQATIRKIVRGFIDNLDLNMVSDETIYKMLEKEYLQSPEYWLAYVLLAIMNWKNDIQEKVEECVSYAMKLDEKSTVLFFMLFNLKLERFDVAVEWFNIYKDLEKVGADNDAFLMLMSCVNKKITSDDDTNPVINEFVDYIKEQYDKDLREIDQSTYVKLICNCFNRMDRTEVLQYPNLRRYLVENQVLAEALSKAKNNAEIFGYLEEISKVKLREKNLFLNKYIDQLISVPSPDEQKIHNEIKKNEELIATLEPIKKATGEILFKSDEFRKLAEENYNNKIKHDTGKLNVVDEIVSWIYVKQNNEINSLTKYNLFSLINPLTNQAYNLYKHNYTSMLRNQYTIAIKDYKSTTDFTNIDAEKRKISSFCVEKTNRLLATVKNTGSILLLLLCGAGFIGSLIGSFSLKNMAVLFYLVMAVAAVFMIISIFKLAVTNPKKRNKFKNQVAQEKNAFNDIIEKMFEEMNSYREEYREADSISRDVQELISRIS